MNKLLIISIFCITLLGFRAFQKERVLVNKSFSKGEHLEYRVHYGFVNAAEAFVDVDDKIQVVNGRPCFKAVVYGRTTGITDWVAKVRDTWASYIDTSAILPHQFYTKKQEGGYKTEDKIVFDHTNNLAKTYELDDDREKKTFPVPDNIQDVVSGYFFLRTVDFSKVKVNDFVPVKAFFDGQVYEIRMKLKGREQINTKFGKINTLKITPMLPQNNFFQDNDALRIWISDDENKIPIRAEIELKIGAISLDIRKYTGLKNEITFIK
ncbi:Protein of unknown function [Pseudarcicella hirudinis]|uniref:DUF3108 domain-containing protein n=1 Tax=Pseudarcicella hirudinis TaxID=1079859 RepID=A0A1I5SKC9_9BACT|nr:DUF3108 domain-containing protein [Pseudarcicella hirudinis]SFP71169.1 Protein of unknown function [Pseudarcicella hirudinis]